MASRDILTLDNSIASRLIRCLYVIALILIAVMVVLGVMRGARIMGRPAMPPPAMANGAVPNPPAAAAPQPPQAGMAGRRFAGRMMMDRRFGRRGPMGPLGMGRMAMRNPMLAGGLIILLSLLRGAIILMIVRVLAEIGLAVLAMPRRTEI